MNVSEKPILPDLRSDEYEYMRARKKQFLISFMKLSTSPRPAYPSPFSPPSLLLRIRSSLRRLLLGAGLALGLAAPVWADAIYPLAQHPATNQMRISFLGTSWLPRLSQAANSVFVECGPDQTFVFDCGSGVIEKYQTMGVPYSRMDKIFLTHLHGDHMGDLSFIYCFGPANDRKTPLYVWGPKGPNAASPMGLQTNEGTGSFCSLMKAFTKWHQNSFSFLSTGLTNGLDGYDVIAAECPYETNAVVYDTNGVRITSIPAVHDRDGAISFLLEWQGLKLCFSGDTRPNYFMLNSATNLDVLIHEVALPPELWAQKNGVPTNSPAYPATVQQMTEVINCSHTPAQALGYMLYQMYFRGAAPRLAVGTHTQLEEDTYDVLMNGIRSWYAGPVTLAKDMLVITVDTDKRVPIQQTNYAFVVSPNAYPRTEETTTNNWAAPKYTNNMMQFSAWLTNSIIPEQLYTNPPVQR
jgi:ribonuclease Z